MATNLTPDQIGRGSRDNPFPLVLPAIAGSFTLVFAENVVGADFAANLVMTVAGPGGTTNIRVTNTAGGAGDIVIQVADADAAITIASEVETQINGNANFSAVRPGTTGLAGRTINVTFAAIGPSSISFFNGNPASPDNTVLDNVINGRATTVDPLTEYSYLGPFSNIIPNRDPLQGMARAAMLYSSFINDIAFDTTNITDVAGIAARANTLRDALQLQFPRSFSSNGIVRVASGVGKVAIKGFRRDSNGFVGRGGRSITDTFVNSGADYGLRQLILRIYDSLTDLFNVISTSVIFADIRSIAAVEFSTFAVEIGEVERAIGNSMMIYDNTIVDNSSDQGLLIYSDSHADKLGAFASSGDYTALQAAVGNSLKLLLKN